MRQDCATLQVNQQASDSSSMTEFPQTAQELRSSSSPSGASFLTQALRKQPRSPRDKQASPKRARVGEGQDVEDEDTTSSPDLQPDDVGGPKARADPMSSTTAGEQPSVFSPIFHCMRTLRTSLDATQTEAPSCHEHLRRSAWVQLQADEHTDDPVEPECNADIVLSGDSPADCPASGTNEHYEHHTIIPEAVEHELPPDATAEVEEELDYMEFDPLLFIKLLPPLEQVVPQHRTALLPRKTRTCKKKTLVLDLDETLVHSCLEAQAVADFTFPVHFNSQEHIIHVRQRPHLHIFMNRVADLFEVVVFTASQKIYAEKLLNILDPDRRLIKHRIFRESCVVVDGNYLKDLSVLGRDLASTLIVDNSPQAFGFQVDNGVPIESWYEDTSDTELLKLLPFLEELVSAEDVRPMIRNRFRMQERINSVVA